jgi:hypothetical protein
MPFPKKTDAAPAPAAPVDYGTPPAKAEAPKESKPGELTPGELEERKAPADVRGRVAHGCYNAAVVASGPLSFSTNKAEHLANIDEYAKFLMKKVWERQAGQY